MLGMFYGEPAFNFNSNISNWDVSSVTDMQGMFAGVSTFNSDISNWDVSSVTNMYYMFGGASSFNTNISNWNVSSVTYMPEMFAAASSFNQNLCPWGPKLPSNFNYGNANDMFYSSGCASTTNPTGPSGPWCAASCS
jgi:surface protein